MTNHLNFYDIAIIGGGINGAGIARDASGNGINVFLCEQQDLGWATSSSSSKLIHGGLRYLEHYEFSLVREALVEREKLLKIAPHIIKPLQFILPHHQSMRPAWLIRAGLFLYDHLGKRKLLPPAYSIKMRNHIAGVPLKSEIKRGFIYSDCFVDDSRLVLLNALSAKNHGATIATRTKFIKAEIKLGMWNIHLQSNQLGNYHIKSKVLINATGPWLMDTTANIKDFNSKHHIKLVKGSHIILRKFYSGNHAYIFQNQDKRVIFTIPYLNDYLLIGTTDIAFNDAPEQASITTHEIHYLCRAVNQYFRHQVSPNDIIWSYSGVRPLIDSASNNLSDLSRDYELECSYVNGQPLITLFGGKITTYRRLAEGVIQLLVPIFGKNFKCWTHKEPLPGGNIANLDVATALQDLIKVFPNLPPQLLKRYMHTYGLEAYTLLKDSKYIKDLGIHFGADLYQQEVDYLIKTEWALNIDDILWRRTKLGLNFLKIHKLALENYLKQQIC